MCQSRPYQIEKLKKNPVFQLSLSSKELFHSNFLYWLSIYDREKFKKLVEELVGQVKWGNDDWKVYREDNHFDLSVRRVQQKEDKSGNIEVKCEYLFVLENKVKSIATKAQLDEYYDKVQKENEKAGNSVKCHFCLLTLTDDFVEEDAIKNQGVWEVKYYKDLAGCLEDVFLNGTCHNKDLYLIDQYRRYIELLSDKTLLNIPKLDDKWDKTASDHFLEDIRLDDLRQKIIANLLATEVYVNVLTSLNLKVELNISDEEIWKQAMAQDVIYLSAGYSNNRLLVHVSKFVTKDVLVRFEVEGDKYKRGVVFRKGALNPTQISHISNNKFKSLLTSKIADLFDWDGSGPCSCFSQELDGGNVLVKVLFGTYNNAKRVMKYQGRKIPKGSTIADVAKVLVEEMKKVKP